MEANMEWNICRICLQEGEMQPIFDNAIRQSESLSLSDKIMQCSSITIDQDTNFPQQICLICIDNLEIAYRFRLTCESSEAILYSIISSNNEQESKMPDNSNSIPTEVNALNYLGHETPLAIENVEQIKLENNCQSLELDSQESGNTSRRLLRKISYQICGQDQSIFQDEFNYKEISEIKNENIQSDYDDDDDDSDDNDDDNDCPLTIVKEEKDDMSVEYLIEGEADYLDSQFWCSNDEMDDRSILNIEDDQEYVPPESLNLIPKKVAVNITDIMPVKVNKVRLGHGKQCDEPTKPLKMCTICGNTYKYQHTLDSHMRRHRNEKPFKCEICSKAFVIKFELNRHMRTHTGQKPYGCRHCDRKFSDFGSRIKHERIHTGEKPYECDVCGRRFALSHVLSSHMLIHTGEKKYQCQICDKKFSKAHHLKAHKNIHEKRNKIRSEYFDGNVNNNSEIIGGENIVKIVPIIEHHRTTDARTQLFVCNLDDFVDNPIEVDITDMILVDPTSGHTIGKYNFNVEEKVFSEDGVFLLEN